MMKRHAGQAGRIIGEALHQLGRIAMLLLVLVLLSICLLGFRLSQGPLQLPGLASRLATAASGQGITVQMRQAELAWAGYRQGGGVPLFLRLGDISIRNAVGMQLVEIPSARLVFEPAALLGGKAPVFISGQQARFPGSTVPVSLAAFLRLDAGFRLASADITVTLGPGRIGAGESSVPISGGGFSVQLTPTEVSVTNGVLALAPIGGSAPHLGFSGAARRDGLWSATLHATADAVQAQDLPGYWPPGMVAQTRDWVTHNIIAGTARNAVFDFTLTAPPSLASVDLQDVSGRFDGSDMTLIWLQGAQPITHLDGTMLFQNPDVAVITATTARLGRVALTSGQMTIVGLNEHDQTGNLKVSLAGTVPDTIGVLNAPPLNLLRPAPPQVIAATGRVQATVTAAIPFKKRVRIEDVGLRVAATLEDAAVATPFQGFGFSHGEGTLNATADGLGLTAKARFGGEPADVKLDMSFAHGGVLRDMTVASEAGPMLLHALGLDAPSALADPVSGIAPYTVRIAGSFAGPEQATVDADLAPVALALPKLGWRKKAGMPAHLALTASVENGDLTALQSLEATGPALDIEGGAQAGALVFPMLDIGRTRAHGTITPPNVTDRDWKIALAGAELDLRPNASAAKQPVSSSGKALPPATPSAGPPWRLWLNFQKLDLAASPAPDLAGLQFFGAGAGSTLLQANGSAGGVTLAITPAGPARRALTLRAPDAGLLLQAMDAFQGLQGGTLSLDGGYGDAPGSTTEGTLTLRNFRLRQAPAFTKVMQGLTLYGVGAATSGPGLGFDQAVFPFSIAGQELQLHDARAYSASLGFTASGRIGLADGNVDIDATVVPAYAVNALPGKIPVIGRLFTAEHGGGLFALRATLTGPLANPQVTVNPLSALTPGLLRGLFGMGKVPAPAK